MVELIDGVVKIDPVFNANPPTALAYHDIGVTDCADNTTVPAPHREAFVPTGGSVVNTFAVTETRWLGQEVPACTQYVTGLEIIGV